MTLTRCMEHSAADWIIDSGLPWQQLVGFGPPRFQAYARLRFLPDPAYVGQSEIEATQTAGARLSETEQLQVVLKVLRAHSRTPDDLYFCFWEGSWGATFTGPMVEVPNRSYFLFRGNVSELGEWSSSEDPSPAFIWPADQVWCVANDVDPHWAGIGASTEAIEQLMADPRLDVVLVDPSLGQPTYG